MKRSVLSTNKAETSRVNRKSRILGHAGLALLLICGCTCGNQEVQEHPKPEVGGTPVSVDTTKTEGPEVQAKSIETPKDTLSKATKYEQKAAPVKEAPKHNSPDQSKIDSIKKAKEGQRRYN